MLIPGHEDDRVFYFVTFLYRIKDMGNTFL